MSDFGTFQGPVNRHVYSQNTTKSDPPKKKHNRIDANVQYEKSERPIAILLQTLLHLSRHSKVFLLRPSLFVRNSHKKTRWWASSLFFSSAAKEKKYALWRTAYSSWTQRSNRRKWRCWLVGFGVVI